MLGQPRKSPPSLSTSFHGQKPLNYINLNIDGFFKYNWRHNSRLLTRRGTISKSLKFSGPSISISLLAQVILRLTVLSRLSLSVNGTLVPIKAFITSSSMRSWVAKFCRLIISWSNFARTIVLSCKEHHMLEICSKSGYTKKRIVESHWREGKNKFWNVNQTC